MLLTDKGARRVFRHELARVNTPEPTKTWKPVSHSRIVDVVQSNLQRLGFNVIGEEYALSRNDQQFFGVLDLQSEISDGIRLAVGLRNSTDKTLSAALCAGDRVLVCSNLCFGGEIEISRKHTVNVERDFNERVSHAITSLRQYSEASAERISRLQRRIIPSQEADSLMLRAYEKGIVGARILPKLIKEWREPSFPEFEPRTSWSMLNAFTEVLKPRQRSQPIAAAEETIRFQALLN